MANSLWFERIRLVVLDMFYFPQKLGWLVDGLTINQLLIIASSRNTCLRFTACAEGLREGNFAEASRNLIAWWIFPWRTVSHNQRVAGDEFKKFSDILTMRYIYALLSLIICFFHTAHSYFSKCSYMSYIFTIWLFNSSPWKDPPFFIGKPSISIRAMALPWQTVSHNQMVDYWCTATGSWALTAQSQPDVFMVWKRLMLR